MEVQTIHILEECCSGCKMAIDSMNQVKEYITEEKLEKVIEAAKEKHRKLEERAVKALGEHGRQETEPGMPAAVFSWITTETKMLIKSDSRQIAKLMTNGCNMGIQSIMEVINKNPEADKESVAIAKDIVKAEERFAEELRIFL